MSDKNPPPLYLIAQGDQIYAWALEMVTDFLERGRDYRRKNTDLLAFSHLVRDLVEFIDTVRAQGNEAGNSNDEGSSGSAYSIAAVLAAALLHLLDQNPATPTV